MVATRGFPDTLLMMRGKVTDGLTEAEAGRLAWLRKPEPFVPRSLVAEVNRAHGLQGAPSRCASTRSRPATALDDLVARGVESVAVCLLWSVANDAHEKAVASILRQRHLRRLRHPVERGPRRSWGEYERHRHHGGSTPTSARASPPTS